MATPLPHLPRDVQDRRVREITSALDDRFLQLVGWDWDQRVVVFPKVHPVLGMPDCQVQGCGKGTPSGRKLCTGCFNRWKKTSLTVEAYIDAVRTHRARCVGEEACLVPNCPRPRVSRVSGLCNSHRSQHRRTPDLALEEFLVHPSVRPLAGGQICLVAACYRVLPDARGTYCKAHRARLSEARRIGSFDGDEERWRLTQSAIAVDREVSLRGLPDLLVAELLYGLQVRTLNGIKTYDHLLRVACDRLRAVQAPSLEPLSQVDLAEAGMGDRVRTVLKGAQKALGRLGATAETERLKDTWQLDVFGHGGTLNFTKIHQRPLREAVKAWACDSLPRRRGRQAKTTMQAMISSVAMLSESLRLQRDDEGHLPALLGRPDMVSFCNRLAFLAEDGRISAHGRVATVRYLRLVLNGIRALGLTRAGQVLEGLPADFMLGPHDVPDEPEDAEAGRDLPDEVMRQLCDNLDLLEQANNREVRVATELLIDTGRRPDEIRQLMWDCLHKDPDGTLVLLYDNNKNYRLGRRLPIAKTTAAVITDQQERARKRFPGTPTSELKLLPGHHTNPEGKKPIGTMADPHRAWVDSLPEFLIPVTVEVDGQPATRMVPFDKSRIFPYAYRHTYAQRHADAGVAPDVLQVLMDHREMSTTQGYYRVSQERRREAVDRVTAVQFDRHGNRVWRKAQGLLESEHVRRAIGEVATAYGICLEPSNVAAGGHACPIRFRCVGCDHFRTDVSYLPDLERYLADLLRSRERLMSAFEADDWARSEAMPSEEEIRRVRRLITRVKADLNDLTSEDRAQIEEAVAMVRRGRTVMLGLPKIGQSEPDVRPWSSM
ncbi:hypothetical protein AB0D08_27635 [Kitasatospora sp. NPDC048540]|uniref:hypothetical protein n=1 Tax=Kitasatospora sp. NPDC048540 TaxID=3155634 RepID=UPI0033E05F19